jgi:hypothetical protein
MSDVKSVKCLLCPVEIESEYETPAPLCAVCKQDNYLVKHEDGTYDAFSNEGQQLTGVKDGVVSLHKFARAKARKSKRKPPSYNPPTNQAG